MSSLGVANMMLVVEMLAGVSWEESTLTRMLKPLNAGILETLTQKLTDVPLATLA
jgi:hypothetical protein